MLLMVGRAPRESDDPYYDLFGDWDLIVSSFLSQYGLRIRTKEFESVSWDEFRSLLAGIGPETALGRVVAIRAEKDEDVIKRFSKYERQIYDDWQKHKAEMMSDADFEKEMAALERMFASMCGGGKH